MDEKNKILKTNLNELLRSKGLSKAELARRMGLKNSQSLTGWFGGFSYPSTKNLEGLARAFGVFVEGLTLAAETPLRPAAPTPLEPQATLQQPTQVELRECIDLLRQIHSAINDLAARECPLEKKEVPGCGEPAARDREEAKQ